VASGVLLSIRKENGFWSLTTKCIAWHVSGSTSSIPGIRTANRNFIHDSPNNALKMEQDDEMTHVSDNQFRRNVILRAGGIALRSAGSRRSITNILIEHNLFDTTLSPAVSLAQVAKVSVIEDFTSQARDYAIMVRSSEDILISDNSITHTDLGRDTEPADCGAVAVFSEFLGVTSPHRSEAGWTET
jgi:hypothetical protein